MSSVTRATRLTFVMDMNAGYDGPPSAALHSRGPIQKRCKLISSAPCKVYIYHRCMLVDNIF